MIKRYSIVLLLFVILSCKSKEEKMFFVERIWQLMSSCEERKANEYERLGWWEYLRADNFSPNYRHLLVEGLTRTLVAAKARTASTKTGGNIFLQLLYCMLDPNVNTDRILKGPTNDMWLNSWKEFLLEKGVKINQGWICSSFKTDINNFKINNVTVTELDKITRKPLNVQRTLSADHYIMAMPVERAAEVISVSEDMIKCDQTLEYIITLAASVNWMNGIQFYLNENVEINQGHIIFSDTEYALTAISQAQFWTDYDFSNKGNGKIKGILSVDISDWFKNGHFNNAPADTLSKEDVEKEVWKQLKLSLNVGGKVVLRDDMKEDFYLDRDIQLRDKNQEFPSVYDNTEGKLTEREPLLVNNVNTWNLRPSANCGITNLFFASDYVKTNTDLATMEGANEAARKAVNCILDIDKSDAEKCQIWNLNQPWYLKLIKNFDNSRAQQGLPWTIKAPLWILILTVLGGIIYLLLGILKLIFNPRK